MLRMPGFSLCFLLQGYTGAGRSVGPPTCVGGREGGRGEGGGPAIPILNRKFSHCRIFSPRVHISSFSMPVVFCTCNLPQQDFMGMQVSLAVDGWEDDQKLPTLAFTVCPPTSACYLYKFQRVTNGETADMLETAINEVVDAIQTELGVKESLPTMQQIVKEVSSKPSSSPPSSSRIALLTPYNYYLKILHQCTTHNLNHSNNLKPSSGSRARSRKKKKNQEKDAQPGKIKRKIVFSDLRNPPKNFTPLFGEVAKFRTLTKKEEQ